LKPPNISGLSFILTRLMHGPFSSHLLWKSVLAKPSLVALYRSSNDILLISWSFDSITIKFLFELWSIRILLSEILLKLSRLIKALIFSIFSKYIPSNV
jgi:hypothetical protein